MDFFPQIFDWISLVLSLSGEGSVATRAWHAPLEISWVEDIYIIQSFINIVRCTILNSILNYGDERLSKTSC